MAHRRQHGSTEQSSDPIMLSSQGLNTSSLCLSSSPQENELQDVLQEKHLTLQLFNNSHKASEYDKVSLEMSHAGTRLVLGETFSLSAHALLGTYSPSSTESHVYHLNL